MSKVRIRRCHGFTLIELLVVISIIALLAAILFPVFGKARENARRTRCSSNLKQLSLGVMQYVQDYDERFPWLYWYLGPDPRDWPGLVYPYIRNGQVYVCPSATGIPANFDPKNGSHVYNYSSYGLNALAFPPTAIGRHLSAIPKPPQLIMICDTAMTSGNPAAQARFADNLTKRHLTGANFSFADGHVKWYPYDVLTSLEGIPLEERVYKYWFLANNNQ